MLPVRVERKQRKHTYVQVTIDAGATKDALDILRNQGVPGREVLATPPYHITLLFGCEEKDWERVCDAIELDLAALSDEKFTLSQPYIVSPDNRDRDFLVVDVIHSKLKVLKSVWHNLYGSKTQEVVKAHITLLEIARPTVK